MGFILRDRSNNGVVHENTLTEKDFYPEAIGGEQFEFSNHIGNAKMRQWMFDGLRMGYWEWALKKPAVLDWEGDIEAVTMYFSLKGGVGIGLGTENVFELGNNQQNMFYGTEASGFMKVDELRMKTFMIQFEKEAFLRIASGGTDALKYFADKVTSKKSCSFSEKGIYIDINSQHAITAIVNCKFNDSLKRVFFLSKAMELMVLQADAHTRLLHKKNSHVKLDYDRDRIVFARDYMLQHMDTPPTIPELARICGINEFKLKKGYKEIFGSTIFGHLAETRLQFAKDALQEGKKSVSEIAFELGYSSVQHFSVAFKKKFGINPRGVRANY